MSQSSAPSGSAVPSDVEAERGVLQQIFANGRRDLNLALQIVQPEDFWNAGYREIYRAMAAIGALGGDPADIVLLQSWLKAHGNLALVGGAAGIADIMQGR
jgi:replicative DNA helicase